MPPQKSDKNVINLSRQKSKHATRAILIGRRAFLWRFVFCCFFFGPVLRPSSARRTKPFSFPWVLLILFFIKIVINKENRKNQLCVFIRFSFSFILILILILIFRQWPGGCTRFCIWLFGAHTHFWIWTHNGAFEMEIVNCLNCKCVNPSSLWKQYLLCFWLIDKLFIK